MNRISARMILFALIIYAVLLPLLFNGLLHIVEQGLKERFVNDVRKYSRFVADVIETKEMIDDRAEITRLLDSAVLGSGGIYAEVVDGVIHTRSELIPTGSAVEYTEDYAFGAHGDDAYFLSIALNIPDRHAALRMGFDEQPTNQQIRLARQQLLIALIAYLVLSLLAIAVMSTFLIGPLRSLQMASRHIAEGSQSEQLQVDSNLTEIRELAQDLETMRSRLVGMNISLQREIREREIGEKKRAVLEDRLRQVDKMETVGVMAGGIAHEFNNILLPIFLYAEQAKHDLAPEDPTHKHLDKILKSARRAKSLVQQILTFSRQSSEPEFKAVDLKPVVTEAIDLLRALIPSKIELHQFVTAENCMAQADRNQIHQLVINLGSNAYKAIGKNNGSITVSLERVTVDAGFCQDHPLLQPGPYVVIAIEDTGHGLEPGKIDRIFEPFYTTRAVGEGTGLGLSVVHGIVLSHKGDITVQSEPGVGTTFRVFLPAYNAQPHTNINPNQE